MNNDHPKRWLPSVRCRYITVLVVCAVITGAGLIRSALTVRHDRLIENNLMLLQAAIDNYATDAKELPDSLDDVDLSNGQYDSARTLLARTDTSYHANSKAAESLGGDKEVNTHFYQLCATFKRARGAPAEYARYGYSSYLYQPAHPAGWHCYNLKITVYL